MPDYRVPHRTPLHLTAAPHTPYTRRPHRTFTIRQTGCVRTLNCAGRFAPPRTVPTTYRFGRCPTPPHLPVIYIQLVSDLDPTPPRAGFNMYDTAILNLLAVGPVPRLVDVPGVACRVPTAFWMDILAGVHDVDDDHTTTAWWTRPRFGTPPHTALVCVGRAHVQFEKRQA